MKTLSFEQMEQVEGGCFDVAASMFAAWDAHLGNPENDVLKAAYYVSWAALIYCVSQAVQ
jgi:hypothetical protein